MRQRGVSVDGKPGIAYVLGEFLVVQDTSDRMFQKKGTLDDLAKLDADLTPAALKAKGFEEKKRT